MHCIRFQLSLLFPTKTHSLHFLELELQLKHGTRLGHPSLSNFKHVLSSIPIKGSTVLPYCEFGSYAKSCKIPFGCFETVTKLPLELVYCDVWGPSPVLFVYDFKFCVVFINDFTKYSWLFPLHAESDVFKVFLTFKLQVKKLLSLKIKTFRSDGGSEFLSNNFQ